MLVGSVVDSSKSGSATSVLCYATFSDRRLCGSALTPMDTADDVWGPACRLRNVLAPIRLLYYYDQDSSRNKCDITTVAAVCDWQSSSVVA